MQEVKIHNAVMYLLTQYRMYRGKNMPHKPSSGHVLLNTTMSSAKVVGGEANLCTLWLIIGEAYTTLC